MRIVIAAHSKRTRSQDRKMPPFINLVGCNGERRSVGVVHIRWVGVPAIAWRSMNITSAAHRARLLPPAEDGSTPRSVTNLVIQVGGVVEVVDRETGKPRGTGPSFHRAAT